MKNNNKILIVFVSMICGLSVLIFGQKVISWKDAHNHHGEYAAVEGTIVDSYNSGKACFLNFHPDYKKHFTAVIFRSDFHKFPAHPEDYYLSKKVRVTGTIKQYQGKPEIILKRPSQIEIIGELEEPRGIKEISWEDADNHYGEYCCVKGKIISTYNSGKACFLNFHKNWKRYFTAVIFASDYRKFPANPENYYQSKTVRVTGIIKKYQGKPEIIVKNPGQIEIIL